VSDRGDKREKWKSCEASKCMQSGGTGRPIVVAVETKEEEEEEEAEAEEVV